MILITGTVHDFNGKETGGPVIRPLLPFAYYLQSTVRLLLNPYNRHAVLKISST